MATMTTDPAQEKQLKQFLKLARQFDGRLNTSSKSSSTPSTPTASNPSLSDLNKALDYYNKAFSILPGNARIGQRVTETKERIRQIGLQNQNIASTSIPSKRSIQDAQSQNSDQDQGLDARNTSKENESGREGKKREIHASQQLFSQPPSSQSRDALNPSSSPNVELKGSYSTSTKASASQDHSMEKISSSLQPPPTSSSSFTSSTIQSQAKTSSSQAKKRSKNSHSQGRSSSLNEPPREVRSRPNPFKRIKTIVNEEEDDDDDDEISRPSTLLPNSSLNLKSKQKGKEKMELDQEVGSTPVETFEEIEEEYGRGVIGGTSILKRKPKSNPNQSQSSQTSSSVQSSKESPIPRAVSRSKSESASPFMSASELFRCQKDEEEQKGNEFASPIIISPNKSNASTSQSSRRSTSPTKKKDSPELQHSPIRGDEDLEMNDDDEFQVEVSGNESLEEDGSPRKRFKEVLKKFTFDGNVGEDALFLVKEQKEKEKEEKKALKEKEKEKKEEVKKRKQMERELKKKQNEIKKQRKNKKDGNASSVKKDVVGNKARKMRAKSGFKSPSKDGDDDDLVEPEGEEGMDLDEEDEGLGAPDLSSIPIQFIRLLTMCPICSTSFGKTKSGPSKSDHVAICSINQDPIISKEEITELIRNEAKRLMKLGREKEIKSELEKSLMRKIVGETLWEEIIANEEKVEKAEMERNDKIRRLGLDVVEKEEEIETGNHLLLTAYKNTTSFSRGNLWMSSVFMNILRNPGRRFPPSYGFQRPPLKPGESTKRVHLPTPKLITIPIPPQDKQLPTVLPQAPARPSLPIMNNSRGKGRGRGRPRARNVTASAQSKPKAPAKKSALNVVAQLLGDVSSTTTILPIDQTREMAVASVDRLLGPRIQINHSEEVGGSNQKDGVDNAELEKDIDGNLIKKNWKGKGKAPTPGWGGSFIEDPNEPNVSLKSLRSNSFDPTFNFSQGVNYSKSLLKNGGAVSHSQQEINHGLDQRKAFLDLYHLEDSCLDFSYGMISTLNSSGSTRSSNQPSSLFSEMNGYTLNTPASTVPQNSNFNVMNPNLDSQVPKSSQNDRPSSFFSSLNPSPSASPRRSVSSSSKNSSDPLNGMKENVGNKVSIQGKSVSKKDTKDVPVFRPSDISRRSNLQKPGIGLGL